MDFDLRAHTILLTVAGSRAYGTHTDASDVDVKGIAIPPRRYYLGCSKHFEQSDTPTAMRAFHDTLSPELQSVVARSKLEGTVFELRKYMGLAFNANPNTLEVLYGDPDDRLLVTPAGQLLIDHRDVFLSRKARHTFSGYAISQLKRIQTHYKWLLDPPKAPPERATYGLPEKLPIPETQVQAVHSMVQKQIDRWDNDLAPGADEATKIAIRERVSLYLSELQIAAIDRYGAAARTLGFDENFIHYIQREKEFNAAQTHWSQYQDWKKARNEARAEIEAKYGYDTKHASHVVRLFWMCRELLSTGSMTVKLPPDAREMVMAVRNGAWSYERLIAFADEQDTAMTALYNTSVLPKFPDWGAVDALCERLLVDALSRG